MLGAKRRRVALDDLRRVINDPVTSNAVTLTMRLVR